MYRRIFVAVLGLTSFAAAETASDVIREMLKPDLLRAGKALEKVEPNAAAARKIAAAAVDAPLNDPRFVVLDTLPMGRGGRDGTMGQQVRTGFARELYEFVNSACLDSTGSAVRRAPLDARFYGLRATHIVGKTVTDKDIVRLVNAYAAIGGGSDPIALAHAIKVLHWARTVPDANQDALREREQALAKIGRKRAPDRAIFRLAGFAARLRNSSSRTAEIKKILKEIAPLTEAKDQDPAVLRFHHNLVSRARRAKVRADYVVCKHALLAGLEAFAPRGGNWRSHTSGKTAQLTRYGDGGRVRFGISVTTIVHRRKHAVRSAIDAVVQTLHAKIYGSTCSRPKKVRLNRKILAQMVECSGKNRAGQQVVVRGFSWGTRKKKSTRVFVALASAVDTSQIDDPELIAVLASLERR